MTQCKLIYCSCTIYNVHVHCKIIVHIYVSAASRNGTPDFFLANVYMALTEHVHHVCENFTSLQRRYDQLKISIYRIHFTILSIYVCRPFFDKYLWSFSGISTGGTPQIRGTCNKVTSKYTSLYSTFHIVSMIQSDLIKLSSKIGFTGYCHITLVIVIFIII